MYRRLDAQAVVDTADRLAARVRERFPERGLASVAAEVVDLAREIAVLADDLARPTWWARVLAVVATVVVLGLLLAAPLVVDVAIGVGTLAEAVQSLESLVNDVVFAGIAVWFVWSVEGRRKRGKALHALAQLRALAHVIDMHQLVKAPEGTSHVLSPTASSPTRDLHGALLARYLDYCSEMLSLVGKLAAVTGQDFDDGLVLSTVEELEELTTGLSRKIWQKIVLIDGLAPAAAVSGAEG